MMVIIGKCALCEMNDVELQESHIIPEFVYKPIYNEKHQFNNFTEDPNIPAKIEQKGFRENLLCKKCECLLSKYEKELKDFFVNKIPNRFENIWKGVTFVKEIKYNDVKIALLSILYRLSVSKNFKGYHLDKYRNKIQEIIKEEKYTDEFIFSIRIDRITIDGKHSDQIITAYENSIKYSKIYIFQQFVIYGYLIMIMISESFPKNDIWNIFNLKENGTIIIIDKDMREINISDKLRKRFSDDDVKKIFNKIKENDKKC